MYSKPPYLWADGHQSGDLSDWLEHTNLPEARVHAFESLRRGWVRDWLRQRGDNEAAAAIPVTSLLGQLESSSQDSDLQRQELVVKLKELDVRSREAERALAQGGV